MADEQKMVYVTLGTMKGLRLTMPTADAAQAIADKWACEWPQAPETVPEQDPPMTDEEREAAFKASEIALNKLRGETPPPEVPPVGEGTRMVHGDEGGHYRTRSTTRK